MGKKLLILHILKNLRKRLKLILLTAIFSMAAVWVFMNYVVTPDYQATSQILVEEATVMPSPEQQPLTAVPSTEEISSAIIRSPEVLKRVILELGLENKKINVLHDQIQVKKAPGSQVMSITVTSTSREEAASIADAVAGIYVEEASGLMLNSKATIVSTASELAVDPIEENLIFSLGVAGAFGLIIGMLLAFISEMLNTMFKTGSRKGRETKEKMQTVFK